MSKKKYVKKQNESTLENLQNLRDEARGEKRSKIQSEIDNFFLPPKPRKKKKKKKERKINIEDLY
jgi:hypothetical protein